jgi:hypothetical protein
VKKIRFLANLPAEVRAISQPIALDILKALHRYIETGHGKVRALSGEFEGLMRLRVGNTAFFSMKLRTRSHCIAIATAKTPTSEPELFEAAR